MTRKLRATFLSAVLLVAALTNPGPLIGVGAATQHCTEITVGNTPTPITSSGCYEITNDAGGINISPRSVINISAENVVLRGNNHTINGVGEGTAIRVLGPPNSTQNNRNVTIRNLTIEDFGTAIEVRDAENVTVRNATLRGPGFGRGIYFDGDPITNDESPALNYNVVTDTAIAGFDEGVYFVNTDRSRIADTEINDTGLQGIYLNKFSSNNDVTGVTVANTGGAGIEVRSQNNVDITDSTVSASDGRGIYANSGTTYYNNDSTIRNVTVRNTTQRGIELQYVDNFTIAETAITNTTETDSGQTYDGLLAVEARNLSLVGLDVVDAAASGIRVEGPSSGSGHLDVRDTTVLGSANNGISVQGNYAGLNDSRLDGVAVEDNAGTGLLLLEAGNVTVSDAMAVGNGQGIVVDAHDTTVLDSNVSENADAGLVLSNADGTTIRRVSADTNVNTGILIGNTTGAAVVNTTARRNVDGFVLAGTTDDVRLSAINGTENTDWSFVHTPTGVPGDNISIRNSNASLFPSNVRFRTPSGFDAAPPSEYEYISDPLETEQVDAGYPGTLNVTLDYTDDTVSGVNESSLDFWSYDGSQWTVQPTSAVSTPNNTVTANLTGGIYAVFGETVSTGGGTPDPPQGDIGVEPTDLAYGNVTDSETRTVTVRNDGGAELTVEEIGVTGADAAAFDPDTTSFSLDGGEQRNVSVTFAPRSGGTHEAALEIDSDDDETPTVIVSLSGTGLVGRLSADSDVLAFGNTTVGTRTNRSLTLTNDGGAPVDVTNVSIGGTAAGQFSVADAPTTLAAGANETLRVAFTPTEQGPAAATLTASGSDNATATVELDGRGTQSDLRATPASYDFGTVEVGASANTTVTVTNNGTGAVTLAGIGVVGANATDFSVLDSNETTLADGNGTTLAAGDRLNVSVGYEPSSAGNASARLQLRNESGAAVYGVPLTGRAIAPELTLDRRSLTFENATVDEQSVRNVTVSNTGTAPLAVNATVQPVDGDFELVGQPNGTLAPDTSAAVRVGFEPSTPNATSGTLSLSTNDPDEGTAVVYLSSTRATADVSLNRTDNTTEVTATVENATAGESVAISVPSDPADPDSTAVDSVSVTPTRNGSFDLNVTSTDERPDNASTFEPTDPTEPDELGYLNITHSIPNENISQATVQFRVNRTRMAQLESEPEDFSLYRLTNGTWERVDTTLVHETNASYVFRGTTSGLSEWTAATEVPRISVSDATANVTAVTTEETVEIQVLLNNTGGSDGRFEVELLLNGSVVERRDVAVAPSTTSLVTFQRGFEQVGTYGVEVNDFFVAAVEVSEGEAEVVEGGQATVGQAASTISGGSGPLSAALAPLAALLACLLARRLHGST